MVDDLTLAKMMDMATNDDKLALMAMLKDMSKEDVFYFKGYVAGYVEATRHLQKLSDDIKNS